MRSYHISPFHGRHSGRNPRCTTSCGLPGSVHLIWRAASLPLSSPVSVEDMRPFPTHIVENDSSGQTVDKLRLEGLLDLFQHGFPAVLSDC